MYVDKEDGQYNKAQGEKDHQEMLRVNKIMDTVSSHIATTAINFLINFSVNSMQIPIVMDGEKYILNIGYTKEEK